MPTAFFRQGEFFYTPNRLLTTNIRLCFNIAGIKKKADRNQIELLSIDDLVPKNHLARKLDAAINLDFIYKEVKDLSNPYVRESIDPVVLIKI